MRILALDLAEYLVGWARGEAGKKPAVGVLELRRKNERIEEAIPRLGAWLGGGTRLDAVHEWLTTGVRAIPAPTIAMLEGVDLVAVENYTPIGAKLFTSPATQEAAIMMNGAVRMACGLWGVPIRCPAASTVRVHFCGQMSAAPPRPRGYVRTSREQQDDRRATKMMVVKRAQLLKYIAVDCFDDNLADAVALWDFSASQWGRVASQFALTEPNS